MKAFTNGMEFLQAAKGEIVNRPGQGEDPLDHIFVYDHQFKSKLVGYFAHEHGTEDGHGDLVETVRDEIHIQRDVEHPRMYGCTYSS